MNIKLIWVAEAEILNEPPPNDGEKFEVLNVKLPELNPEMLVPCANTQL